MVLVQNLKIFVLNIFGKIGKENVFEEILHRNKVSLDNRNINFRKSKNCFFTKGLVRSLGDKFELFSPFYIRENRQGKGV